MNATESTAWNKTACIICSLNCGLEVQTEGGRIVKARTASDAVAALRKAGGEILLTHTLDESFIPLLRVVDGIMLEGVSEMPWEMIKMTNPRIVYVSQLAKAMELFEEHLTVTLDGTEKLVYEGSL